MQKKIKEWSESMQMVLIIIGVVILIGLYFLFTHNRLVELENSVDEAFSTMDVYLKKRWDLVPNLVETVKGYTKYESETLKEIIELRTNSYSSLSNEEKLNKNMMLTKGITKIMALAESYPDLKSSENFQFLSSQIEEIENEIAQARKYYNAVVKEFNDKVEMIPSNIVAKMMRLTSKTMFNIIEEERANIKVKF